MGRENELPQCNEIFEDVTKFKVFRGFSTQISKGFEREMFIS